MNLRHVFVLVLAYVGVVSGPALGEEPLSPQTVDWVFLDIAEIVAKTPDVAEARRKIEEQFHRMDKDGGGIGEFEYGRARASLRAMALKTWLARDLDGDGSVTRLELEQAQRAKIRQSLTLPRNEKKTQRELDIELEIAVRSEMLADQNKDGVVTVSEIVATSDPEMDSLLGPGSLPPAELDRDKNGAVSVAEYMWAADQVLAGIDPDRDGKLSDIERFDFGQDFQSKRVSVPSARHREEQVRMAAAMAGACGLPPVPPDARIILVASKTGSGLSTVGLGDESSVVTVGDVRIDSGRDPLYVALYSKSPMIWRFSGRTQRVVQVIAAVQSLAADRMPQAGVTGLAPERVFIVEGTECARQFAGTDKEAAEHVARVLEAMLGRPVASARAIRRLGWVTLPSGPAPNDMTLPDAQTPSRGAPGEMLSQAMQYRYLGGLVHIEPGDIRARVRPVPYGQLPGLAGLAQLADRGAIKVLDNKPVLAPTDNGWAQVIVPTKILVREKIRLWELEGDMINLNARIDLTFVLAPGVPEPDDLPYWAKVVRSPG